jgi:methylated-DNA-protein-cysteine methyltransferase-like protein
MKAAQIRRTALYSTLAQVPEGKVVSYGQLAELAGLGAPPAGWPDPQPTTRRYQMPWHRVLGAGGRISLPPGSPSGTNNGHDYVLKASPS